jgi:Tfp pilus assembly protein PilN
MKTIDFLPDIYRQRAALRKARVWWCIVVLLFGGTIGSAISAQVWLRFSLKRQLAVVEEAFLTSQTQVRELAMLQSQISVSSQEASLFTYLQHPWPRSQLLAQIVQPLPPQVRLTQIHVSDEELPRESPQAGPQHRGAPEADAVGKLAPSEEDLTRLQQEMDYKQTVVELQGFTPEATRLHEYVGALNTSPFIASAHIKSLETDADQKHQRTRFTLRLMVRPGYGQRGNETPLPDLHSQEKLVVRQYQHGTPPLPLVKSGGKNGGGG